MSNNGWETFFDFQAPDYMDEVFTKHTIAEVDFLEEEFKLKKGASILDIGCGTGRHSIELARRGYNVTGLDISEKMLDEGKKTCETEGIIVDFIQADAVKFHLKKKFDVCICLCEGAFGLLSMDEDPFDRDQKILDNIFSSLKSGAKFILTAINGMRFIRKYSEEDIDNGIFDPVSIVEIMPLASISDNALPNVYVKEKGFLPTELKLMLQNTGFKVKDIWGGTAGSWNRERLKMDEMELMIISEKCGR